MAIQNDWNDLRLKLSTKERPPLLLLGAGASIESGGRTADYITDEILKRLYGESSAANLRERFLRDYGLDPIFENVLDVLGKSGNERRDLLIRFFKGLTRSDGYKYLAALLKAGYFYPIVISLNFDTLLEDAVKDDEIVPTAKTMKILVQEEIPGDPTRLDPNQLWLVKLHGDLNSPNSLKITKAETTSLTASASGLLAKLLVSQGMVSIGYRGADLDVLLALISAEASNSTVFWTFKGKSESIQVPYLKQFMEKQNAKPLLNTSFDDLFSFLGAPFEATQLRRKYQDEFEKCWIALYKARGYAKHRKRALRELEDLLDGPLIETKIWERDALKELLAFENNGRLLVHRLRRAVGYLQDTLNNQLVYLDEKERIVLTYRLIEELLNIFISVDTVPDSRKAHLQKAIALAKGLSDDKNANPILKAKIFMKLGELLKEEIILEKDSDGKSRSFDEARRHLNEAIDLLSKAKGREGKYCLAAAHRHIAVTYELDGDVAQSVRERKECYQNWQNHSTKAQHILRELGEDSLYSYATMNLASSYTRLATNEINPMNKMALIDQGNSFLGDILRRFEKLSDHRGLGWAHYHICENLRAQAQYAEEKDKLGLFFDAEEHAYFALAELRQTLDKQGIGLAYCHLGLSAYEVYSRTGRMSEERLNEAFWALSQAIKMIEDGLYYRATAETCLGLSEYYLEKAKQTDEDECITKSIEWRMKAITNVANRLSAKETLLKLVMYLDKELNDLLSK